MKTLHPILACLLSAAHAANPVEPAKPNIVFILCDALGYGNVSSCGATKIKTPNIDRLAREGMKFTDALWPEDGTLPVEAPPNGNGYTLESGRMTMAALIKTEGYRSAA